MCTCRFAGAAGRSLQRRLPSRYQLPPRLGFREAASPRDPARGTPGFSGHEGARPLIKCRCASSLVPERNLQARSVRRSRTEQSRSGTKNPKKMSAGASDAPTDRRGGDEIPGAVRTPGETDSAACDLRGAPARRGPCSLLEGARRRRHPRGAAGLQGEVRTHRKMGRSATARSATERFRSSGSGQNLLKTLPRTDSFSPRRNFRLPSPSTIFGGETCSRS